MITSNVLNRKVEDQIKVKLDYTQFKCDVGKIIKIEHLLITIQQDLSILEIKQQVSLYFIGDGILKEKSEILPTR